MRNIITEKEMKEIVKLHELGVSQTVIAKRFSVKQATISRKLKEHKKELLKIQELNPEQVHNLRIKGYSIEECADTFKVHKTAIYDKLKEYNNGFVERQKKDTLSQIPKVDIKGTQEQIRARNIEIIAKHYGYPNQLNKTIEELEELSTAIKNNDTENIIEEVADVIIMCKQLEFLLPEEKVNEVMDYKLKRQLGRIKNEKAKC